MADKLWRIRTTASWKRIVYDLHHSTGIFTSTVLLVITASGVVIHYQSLGNAIEGLNHSAPTPPAVQPPSDAGSVTISSIAPRERRRRVARRQS